MARTIRLVDPNPYSRESRPARKTTTRALRRANRRVSHQLVRSPTDFDGTSLPVHRGTQGWLTH